MYNMHVLIDTDNQHIYIYLLLIYLYTVHPFSNCHCHMYLHMYMHFQTDRLPVYQAVKGSTLNPYELEYFTELSTEYCFWT